MGCRAEVLLGSRQARGAVQAPVFLQASSLTTFLPFGLSM